MSDDIRDLLARAPAPPMSIDPYAAVRGGRRRVRRRRAGLASIGVAAVGVVAAVALQLGGAPRALAPAGTPPTPLVPTSGPVLVPFPSGSAVVNGEIRHPDGTGVRIALQPRTDGRIVEWMGLLEHGDVYGLSQAVRDPIADGEVSWSTGGTHGARSLRGYFAGTVPSAAVAVALPDPADRPTVSVQGMSDGRHTVFDAVAPTDTAFRSVVGLAWVVNGHSVAQLSPEAPPTAAGSVVATADGDQYIVWRTATAMGATGGRGSTATSTSSGDLLVARGWADQALGGQGTYGWARGSSVAVSSTDPSDRWTISYGEQVQGWTPFVILADGGRLRGTLTVSDGSSSVTLAP